MPYGRTDQGKSLAIKALAWLFKLGTEPRRVHWCLLVRWCDT